jgi:hypothetical protein
MKRRFLPPVPPPLSRASSEEGDADFLSAAAIAKTDLDARSDLSSADYAREDFHYSTLALDDVLEDTRAGVRALRLAVGRIEIE